MFLGTSSDSLELAVVSKTSNNLARVPNTPDQERTTELQAEMFWSLGSQDMDTSGCQVSDLDDNEFCWEKDQLDVNVAFRQGNVTPFSPTVPDDL